MDFTRFLAAKKDLDSRSFNQHVWTALTGALRPASAVDPVRVLEIGAGIGTMIERLLERGLFSHAHYTAIDLRPVNLAEAWRRLTSRSDVEPDAAANAIALTTATGRVTVNLRAADVTDLLAEPAPAAGWDLVLANACLDELALDLILPPLARQLAPGGLAYFTINFDGLTVFRPVIDEALDDAIEAAYHRTMEERRIQGRPSGGSRTGRDLFGRLRRAGLEILAAGSSDWVVFAGPDGYPGDEAYLVRSILDILAGALTGRPEIDQRYLNAWLAERHAQLRRGELVYIAHQIDILGRAPAA